MDLNGLSWQTKRIVKRYISRFLKTVAAFFLCFPVVYIVITATLFDIPLKRCVGILLSPFYYIVCALVMLTGFGILEMRRWSWYLLIISQVLVTYENAILVQGYAESHHKVFAFLLSILCQIGLIYRIAQEIRVPYFFPRIRWWESNPRYRLSVPVQFTDKSGKMFEGEILDLSATGCFIKFREDLARDELVSLRFKVFGHEIQTDGTIVWCAHSTVTHPKGAGVKFNVYHKSQKRSLRLIHRRLKKMADFYRRFRYLMSQDEFLTQMEKMESATLTAPQSE
jgi:hypothetical protein